MDSDALNTFLIVHRRGGISNAAKALHRSQPAISRRIALLEQELGVPLFERVAGRTRLSDAGRVMVPYAERAVAAAQDAENRTGAETAEFRTGVGRGGRHARGWPVVEDLEAFRRRTPGRRSYVAHRDQRRGQRSRSTRRCDDRLALRSGRFARSRLRIAVCRTASGCVRAGPSACRRPRRKACGFAGRALDRLPRNTRPARDHGLACLRTVSDPWIG